MYNHGALIDHDCTF